MGPPVGKREQQGLFILPNSNMARLPINGLSVAIRMPRHTGSAKIEHVFMGRAGMPRQQHCTPPSDICLSIVVKISLFGVVYLGKK